MPLTTENLAPSILHQLHPKNVTETEATPETFDITLIQLTFKIFFPVELFNGLAKILKSYL